jgi:hypothetical protein
VPAEISPTDEVAPVATGAELDAAYWAHLINAVHQAYDVSRAMGDADPRGKPGTITWSSAYYGVNPPA